MTAFKGDVVILVVEVEKKCALFDIYIYMKAREMTSWLRAFAGERD